jgi:hypothetical protein
MNLKIKLYSVLDTHSNHFVLHDHPEPDRKNEIQLELFLYEPKYKKSYINSSKKCLDAEHANCEENKICSQL